MKRLEIILKWVVPIVIIGLLYSKVKADLPTVSNILNNIRFTFTTFSLFLFLIILMMVNWLLEAIKWKWLIHEIEEISTLQSVKAILNGLAYGLFTPFRVGDIFTRIFHMKSEVRRNALGSVFVCRSAQLVSTVIMGVIGAGWLYSDRSAGCSWVLLVILPIAIWIHYNVKLLTPIISKFNILSPYLSYVNVMSDYSTSDYTNALIISMLRYIVIIVQYGLMFAFFGIEISATLLFIGVSLTLLLKSILPIVSIVGDFGVREIVAIYVFATFEYSANQILLVTISIWLLNIVLPSIIGAFLSKNFNISS